MQYAGHRTQSWQVQHLVTGRPFDSPPDSQGAPADNNAICTAFRWLVLILNVITLCMRSIEASCYHAVVILFT